MDRSPTQRLVAIVILLAIAGCMGPSPAAPPSIPPASPSADGWIVLFDGSTADAFRGNGEASFPASWAIQDGSLRAMPGLGVDLVTYETFSDFELTFESRVSPGANSGVIHRVTESDQPSWSTGPEYQVLDDDGHPDGQDPRTAAASLYGLIGPDGSTRLAPVGEFNTGRVVIRDGHVEHWLNGSRPRVQLEQPGHQCGDRQQGSRPARVHDRGRRSHRPPASRPGGLVQGCPDPAPIGRGGGQGRSRPPGEVPGGLEGWRNC